MTSIGSLRRTVFMVVLALVALALPLSESVLANHGNRTLDAEPETGTRDISDDPENPTQPWVITATLSSPPTFATGAVNIDFENEGGPNDPDGGASLNTPDAECAVAAGLSSCSISYTGTQPGTDVWRVWIDHDGLNGVQGGSTEADTEEGRDETTTPGNPTPPDCPGGNLPNEPEPLGEDCTDVVEVTWTTDEAPPVPATLDCDDSSGNDRERETNPHSSGPQSNETYTCKVLDQYGNPSRDSDPETSGNQAVTVKAEVENEVNDPDEPDSDSKDTPDYDCDTPTASDGNGECEIMVTQGELELGTAEICFWVGTASEGNALCGNEETGPRGEDDGDNLADRVELTWANPQADGLDLETEKETLTVGVERTITATVYDQFETPFQGDTTVHFEFFNGSPNDPNDDGNTPETPDASCETTNNTTCEYKYTGTDAGRDLICGWVGDNPPTMNGNARNAKGTCNDEGRFAEGDDETQADRPAEVVNVDVVETTYRNNPDAATLECTPETTTTALQTQHQVRCEVEVGNEATFGSATLSGFEIDAELVGDNDPDGNNSRKSPDRTCRTNSNGVCTLNHTGSDPGTTWWTLWVDSDYDDETVEVDGQEGRNENQKPGASEPDTTEKVVNRWTGGGEREVKLWKTSNEVERGDTVKLHGRIDDGETCVGDQQVKLKAKRLGTSKWSFRGWTTSRASGYYSFGQFQMWNDMRFKAVTPKNGACEWAISKGKIVRTTN